MSRAAGHSLFFYGSLRAHEVRVAVLGEDFKSEQMQDASLGNIKYCLLDFIKNSDNEIIHHHYL